MADQHIHGGVKKVRKADQCLNIRLDIMIFVLIDGLLAHGNSVGELLLRHSGFEPQLSQIYKHGIHLRLLS